MELAQSPKQSCHDTSGWVGVAVHEELLSTLQLYGPMSIEDLVEKLPQFRWVEVLRAVSQLWGLRKVELEQHLGQLKVWSLPGREHVDNSGQRRGKQLPGKLKLTVL